jgi:murein DD-endopeptidase MepM/ murein hydrolase activator NlpD
VTSDRFGEYGRGRRDANHGVSFLNSTGTPVLAAADGAVVVAGNDEKTLYGPRTGYYGNLVILRHALPGIDQDVFTLYSQLSQISVQEGQTVTAGQEIGRSGSSGAVRGSMGALAGRILDAQGKPARVGNILLERLAGQGGPAVDQIYLKTYADLHLAGLAPWAENFAAGDLVPGSYQISFWSPVFYQKIVEILPGQLVIVNFQLK